MGRRVGMFLVGSLTAAEAIGGGPVIWVVAGVAVLLLAGSSLRLVEEDERVVVIRLGRMVRVAGPGPVLKLPLIERFRTVSLRPTWLEFGVPATTRDGIDVHVNAAILCRVTDPGRSVVVSTDPLAATVTELQSRLAREIARTGIASLLPSRAQFELDLPPSATAITATWGVDVIEVEVADVEARLTEELLSGLRRQPSVGRE